jgi:hypothetical protein
MQEGFLALIFWRLFPQYSNDINGMSIDFA